jgi:hypothetical protein
VLLICGSLNQTTMMHQIGQCLPDAECSYTPFYVDGPLGWAAELGLLDFTITGPGGRFRRLTDQYLGDHRVPIDFGAQAGPYDLVLTCTDLVIQRNIRRLPIVLVQEGMTDPITFVTRVVRALRLPRWLASTSTAGLSRAYRRFCVASEGYRDFFIAQGAPAERLVVTGIPNFDDCQTLLRNDFPHRGYVMVATSDTRETFRWDHRRRFFDRVEAIAAGRPLLFKLHPNEDGRRSSAEIRARFPEALIFGEGHTGHMVANCSVLITQYSSVVYLGLALDKECHSFFDLDQLRRLAPLQNGGQSARNIADVCRSLLATGPTASREMAGVA